MSVGDTESVKAMWSAFSAAHPRLMQEAATCSAWHFCSTKADADELADLVLAGVKRATAGALWSYEAEGEEIPRVGDLSVITDWEGNAKCVIRTLSVEIVPFEDVSEEFAATEGEGDGSLEYWRKGHWAYFSQELAELGREPVLDMPVVCERFEVVYLGE